jgi:hypothetical protein
MTPGVCGGAMRVRPAPCGRKRGYGRVDRCISARAWPPNASDARHLQAEDFGQLPWAYHARAVIFTQRQQVLIATDQIVG